MWGKNNLNDKKKKNSTKFNSSTDNNYNDDVSTTKNINEESKKVSQSQKDFSLETNIQQDNKKYQQTRPTSKNFSKQTRNIRKPRTIYSKWQLKEMKEAFLSQAFLTGDERKKLADELSMTTDQIKVWFQNYRNKMKRQGRFINMDNYTLGDFKSQNLNFQMEGMAHNNLAVMAPLMPNQIITNNYPQNFSYQVNNPTPFIVNSNDPQPSSMLFNNDVRVMPNNNNQYFQSNTSQIIENPLVQTNQKSQPQIQTNCIINNQISKDYQIEDHKNRTNQDYGLKDNQFNNSKMVDSRLNITSDTQYQQMILQNKQIDDFNQNNFYNFPNQQMNQGLIYETYPSIQQNNINLGYNQNPTTLYDISGNQLQKMLFSPKHLDGPQK